MCTHLAEDGQEFHRHKKNKFVCHYVTQDIRCVSQGSDAAGVIIDSTANASAMFLMTGVTCVITGGAVLATDAAVAISGTNTANFVTAVTADAVTAEVFSAEDILKHATEIILHHLGDRFYPLFL